MSKRKINYLITDHNITVNYDGETHIVPRTDALADRLIKAVREQDLESIPNLVSTAKRIEKFSNGKFTVEDGKILVNGLPAPTVLGNKIVKFASEGLPYKPLVHFAEKLQENPSFRAVNELFQFLEKNDHPITETGNFIAYKRVRGDFKDIYSGQFDNSPGAVPEVQRNQVDEDPTKTCSKGLHVANWDYAHNQYGNIAPDTTDVMVEVEVNPADVVAVPVDYNQSKMRVCKYIVLGVIANEHAAGTSLRVTNPSYRREDDCFNDTCISCDDEECEDCNEDCDFCEGCENCEEEDEYPWDDELA